LTSLTRIRVRSAGRPGRVSARSRRGAPRRRRGYAAGRDLGRLLYEATLPDTEYLFDDTITGLDQDDDGVTVTFEKASPRRFGLVVGADGLHSAVRALAFGPESECVRSLDLYTAWFTAVEEMDLDGWFLMYNAPGGQDRPARLRVPGRTVGGPGIPYFERQGRDHGTLGAQEFSQAGPDHWSVVTGQGRPGTPELSASLVPWPQRFRHGCRPT
jgi:2-polyprenyl-6-methoxyphenol hydroxylase-like FAD-dependent oxidoreductase